MDTKTPEERSLNMSHIRSKDTKPEKWFENIFFMRDSDIEKTTKDFLENPILSCRNIRLLYL